MSGGLYTRSQLQQTLNSACSALWELIFFNSNLFHILTECRCCHSQGLVQVPKRRAESLKVLVVLYPLGSLGEKLMYSINYSLVCPFAFLPLLLPRSLSISGPVSWVERALMFQILNYSWNICLASRLCCSLLRNLHLAPETSQSAGLCHLSKEGQFFQFRNRVLQAISDCISVRVLLLSPFPSPSRRTSLLFVQEGRAAFLKQAVWEVEHCMIQ